MFTLTQGRLFSDILKVYDQKEVKNNTSWGTTINKLSDDNFATELLPHKDALSHSINQAKTQIEIRYFNSNGAKIAYFDEGKGKPVVLLHGLSTSSMMWVGMPGANVSFFSELSKKMSCNRPRPSGPWS